MVVSNFEALDRALAVFRGWYNEVRPRSSWRRNAARSLARHRSMQAYAQGGRTVRGLGWIAHGLLLAKMTQSRGIASRIGWAGETCPEQARPNHLFRGESRS